MGTGLIDSIGVPGDVTAGRDDINEEIAIGSVIRLNDGRTFKYVKFDNGAGNVAAVAKSVCYKKTNDGNTVTSDQSDSIGGVISDLAGFFLNVVTDLRHTWIQIGGLLTSAVVPPSTAVGDALIGSATDLTLARVAADTAPTNKVAAWALAAVSGGVADVDVVAGG